MVTELDRCTADAGVLPSRRLNLLLKLNHASDQRLRMSDQAETTFLCRGGVTWLAAWIEADGLLRREACPDDGHGAFAVLTPAGSDGLRRARPVYRQVLVDRFAVS